MSNTVLYRTALLLITVSIAAQRDSRADDGWEIGAGAVFLNRDASYSGGLVVDNGHAPVLGGSALNTGYHSGINVDVTRNYSDTHGINVRFFAIDDWTVNDAATTSNGAWIYGTGGPGSATITDVSGTFAADLYSAELNLVHDYNEWIELLAGFRWLSINEDLDLVFTETMNPYAEYEGYAKNDLYGFQGGAEIDLFDHGGPFTLEGIFKAGIYGNNASYDGEYENGVMTRIGNSTTTVAFVGEIGIVGEVLLTDHVSIRAGYQLLWVEGLALLGEQFAAIDWVTESGGSTSGSAFYHGAVVNVTVLLP